LPAAVKEWFRSAKRVGNSRVRDVRDKCFPKPGPSADIDKWEHMVGVFVFPCSFIVGVE
jgi:hypothetical protein